MEYYEDIIKDYYVHNMDKPDNGNCETCADRDTEAYHCINCCRHLRNFRPPIPPAA